MPPASKIRSSSKVVVFIYTITPSSLLMNIKLLSEVHNELFHEVLKSNFYC